MDLIIKNGTIVTEKEMFKADIAVKDQKIAAIGADLSDVKADKVVDALKEIVARLRSMSPLYDDFLAQQNQ